MDSLRPFSLNSLSAASPTPPTSLSNDDIEAVIQMATSSRSSPDGGRAPLLRDTRTQLFVGNLPYRVRWQDLKDLFRKAGTVLRADVSLGPDNRSRGYGTVLLATAEEAGRAIDMFNGYSWQTRTLEVRPDRLPPDLETPTTGGTHINPLATHSFISEELDYAATFGGQDTSSRNLFVGNLPFHCQWQDLKDLFRQAGTITRADVALGPDGRSRGFGTVVFATEVDADRAVKLFNGYEYNGRALKVHHDKYSQVPQPASPVQASLQGMMSATSAMNTNSSFSSQHITLPPGFQLDFDPSLPSSPYEMYHPVISAPSQQQQLHQQQQLQRLHLENTHLANPMSRHDIDSLSASLKSTQISNPPATHLSSLMKTSSLSVSLPSSRSTTGISEKTPSISSSSSISQHHHHHPHHPGPICLPPPPNVTFSLPSHLLPSNNKNQPLHPLSSSYTNNPSSTHSATSASTPHGLPPITPSMPPFTFLPPLASPGITYHSSTPSSIRQQQQQPQPISPSPLYQTSFHPAPHPLHQQQQRQPPLPSPGTHPQLHHAILAATYSPGVAMSPGAFWGRPGEVQNPFINPAVGAPVHPLHHHSLPSPAHPHPAGVYGHAMHSPGGYFYSPHQAGAGVEPKGYFDAMYSPPTGANAASAAALASSGGVAAEIMKDTSQDNAEKNVVEKVEKGVGADGGIQASSSTSSSSLDDQRLSRDKSPQSASSSMAETNATGASWFTKSESGDQDQDREDVVEHGPVEVSTEHKTHSLNASRNNLNSVRGFEDENVISRSHSMSGKRESGGACGRDRGRGEVVVQVDPPQGVHRSESEPNGRLMEQALHAIVSGGQQTTLESQPQPQPQIQVVPPWQNLDSGFN